MKENAVKFGVIKLVIGDRFDDDTHAIAQKINYYRVAVRLYISETLLVVKSFW